jgi:hypothetical protein
VHRLRTGRSEIRISVRARDFLTSWNCPDWLWGPSFLQNSFWGVQRPGNDAGHSSPSGAEVMKEWNYISTTSVYFHDVGSKKITSHPLSNFP